MSYSNYSSNHGHGHTSRHKPFGSYSNGNGSSYKHATTTVQRSSSGGNGIPNPPVNGGSSVRSSVAIGLTTAKSISSIAKNEIEGTNVSSGVNSHDLKFAILSIHSDYLIKQEGKEPSKTYKVSYDPELDKSLSKSEKKSKHIKLKYHDPNHHGLAHDPRITFQGGLDSYLHKPNKRSKKFPYKQLPQTKFVFDKDSLGPPPLLQLVMWDFPTSTSEIYLSNFFKTYGSPIKDLKFINDSENGAPLGIVTFEFQGNREKASRLAEKVVKESKQDGIYIDGVHIKIDLNDHEGKLLQSKVKDAESKLKAFHVKLQEEKKKAKLLQEKKLAQENKKLESTKMSQLSSSASESTKTDAIAGSRTILSKHHNNKVVKGCFLPNDLKKYIKQRPFILIRDKYISTKKVSSLDIKRTLSKYSWTRVMGEKEGFFIVFNSLKECERCFYKEDVTRFYEYRMVMELCIPEGFVEDKSDTVSKNVDIVGEATNILIKDLELYLKKDIRERIIAPVILDLLSDENYPEIVKELKEKEAAQKKVVKPVISSNTQLKENALSLLTAKKAQPLPTFKRKNPVLNKPSKSKASIIPMLHALNFDHDSDDSDDESSRSMTPVATTLKRLMSNSTSVTTDELDSKEPPKKKKKASKKTFLYESSEGEDEMDVDIEESKDAVKEQKDELMEEVEEEEATAEVEEEIDEEAAAEQDIVSDEAYQPTYDFPHPVYEDDFELAENSAFDLNVLKDAIRDQEDWELMKELFEDVAPTKDIKNIDYWAWKLNEEEHGIPQILAEQEEEILPLDSRLDSATGSFRSDGYKKILDSDKIEYLPHRRKVHKPIKTIQHDDEEGDKAQQNSNHSSRVNRANNRRLAADISAQKQMIGSETDILTLNSLTKRKKPVSFARSVIHNWGLYALEPIAAKEMIIEYVGESIRQQVAEHRERSYLKTGIGSSYLFRIDENTVIDATKKGGIARFINHCCSPSCTARIIKVDGKKRIVIYALRDIEANEELTYDYKFERETNDNERIRCLCGAPGCKGYLN